ncbi:MAG: DUF748 domain-containing protein [Flavobacteriales bacterium]|nr:DUF748 domain-containing protein [Flavobacteriales bacterium]
MKKRYIVLIVGAVLLIGFRLALPSIAKNHINKQLDNMEGYHASIDGIGMRLYRGAFQIQGLRVVEEASTDTTIAMVELPHMEFSIDWGSLFDGRFVGEVFMDSPVLNLSKLKEEESKQASEYRIAFFEDVQKMNPIQLNRFEAVNATISYRDPTSDPEINVSMDNISVLALNLGNVRDPEVNLPASVEIGGNAMGEGSINLNAKLNLLKEIPDFDIDIRIEEIELVKFNQFTEARANLPIESGKLYFYSEVVGKDGAISGYVKPAFEDLTIRRDSSDNLVEKVYQSAVQGVTNLLEDGKKDQVATRVEISGTLDKAEARPLQAVLNLFRNGFIEAYSREIEYVLDFDDKGKEDT